MPASHQKYHKYLLSFFTVDTDIQAVLLNIVSSFLGS